MDFFVSLLRAYDAQIASFSLTLLATLIYWVSQARVRLRWGHQHGFRHRLAPLPQTPAGSKTKAQPGGVQPQPIMISTASYYIANEGRRTAKKTEIAFNYKPDNYAIWPQRNYGSSINPEGRFILSFDTISPHERFIVNILNINNELPSFLSIRCDESIGKEIEIMFAKKFKRYVYITIWSLVAIGLFSMVYFIVSRII